MQASTLRETVEHLSVAIGPRAPGSRAEKEAAEYVKNRFSEMGLPARIETFASASHRALRSTLQAGDGTVYPSTPTQFSPGGRAAGALVYLDTGRKKAADYGDLRGKIGLLVPEGRIKQRIRFMLDLEKGGLGGLIVVSPYLDNIMTKVVRYPEIERLPIVAVSWRSGVLLRKREGQDVQLEVETEEPGANESRNVVATLDGEGPGWLVVTSHLDTAAFAPGALDNASGVAVMLEAARGLAGKRLPATVVFAATGSEEYGLTDGTGAGAQAFFKRREQELENCIAHVEIDDVGNVLGVPKVYTAGHRALRDLVLAIQTDLDYVYHGKHAAIGCDHGAAEQRGIPYVWMIDAGRIGPAPYPPTYHSPLDGMEFMDFELAEKYVGFLRDVIAGLAAQKPFLPARRENGFLIRQARFDDLPAILDITRLAFEHVSMNRMREVYFGHQLGGKPWHAYKNEEVEGCLKANIYACIVSEVEGRVVGYATCLFNEQQEVAAIGNNAVHPDFQRRGIGKAMQAEIERRMKENGYRQMVVNTLSHDLPARKIYEKMGYEKITEQVHYFRSFH